MHIFIPTYMVVLVLRRAYTYPDMAAAVQGMVGDLLAGSLPGSRVHCKGCSRQTAAAAGTRPHTPGPVHSHRNPLHTLLDHRNPLHSHRQGTHHPVQGVGVGQVGVGRNWEGMHC